MSQLLAGNHLALEPLMRARLAEALAVMPGGLAAPAVGGLVEYMDLLDGAEAVLPAVFVLYDGDQVDSGTGSPHQLLMRQQWQVVIAVAPEIKPSGADLQPMGVYMAQVIKALSGVRLADGLRPLARVADGSEMLYGNGVLFAFLSFALPVELR